MKIRNIRRNVKVAGVFKSLGHPTRIYIVRRLSDGECPVGVFVDELGADFSTVSQHLSVLKSAGVVESEKRGLNVFYRLVYPCIPWLIERMEYRDRLSAKGEAVAAPHIAKKGAKPRKK